MKFDQGRQLDEILSITMYSTFINLKDAGHVLSKYARIKLCILGQYLVCQLAVQAKYKLVDLIMTQRIVQIFVVDSITTHREVMQFCTDSISLSRDSQVMIRSELSQTQFWIRLVQILNF